MEALTGAMEALTGAMEALTGAIEAITGAIEALTGAIDADTGAIETEGTETVGTDAVGTLTLMGEKPTVAEMGEIPGITTPASTLKAKARRTQMITATAFMEKKNPH